MDYFQKAFAFASLIEMFVYVVVIWMCTYVGFLLLSNNSLPPEE